MVIVGVWIFGAVILLFALFMIRPGTDDPDFELKCTLAVCWPLVVILGITLLAIMGIVHISLKIKGMQ